MIDTDKSELGFILTPKHTYSMSIAYGAITISGIRKQPNLFHRLMYRLLLGIKWSKND